MLTCCIDPEHWSSSDVGRWLNWLLRQYGRPCDVIRDDADEYSLDNNEYSLDGVQLCQLSTDDVTERFPHDGEFVIAELQLWKNLGPLGQ